MKNTSLIGRFLRRRRQFIALITSVLLSSIALAAVAEEGSASATSSSTSTSTSASSSTVFNDVEALVKQYYPKAKIVRTDKSLHFDYKARGLAGVQSGLKEFSPDSGGIAGDISIHSGKYTGKERQPSETNHILHMVLFMAPYSEPQDKHYNTRLSYPPDASVEFLNQFKSIISDQQKGGQEVAKHTDVSPKPVPAATVSAATPATDQAVSAPVASAANPTPAAAEKPAEKPAPDKTLNVQFGAKKLSKYSYPEGRFKVLLPGNPQMKYSSQLGMRSVDYTYPEANGVYVMNYLIAPGPIVQSKINPLLELLCNNLVQNSKSTEIRRTAINLQGYAGRQIELKTTKGKEENAVFRFYVVRRFVYIIGVAGNKAWVGSPVVTSYLNSLEVVPELTAAEQMTADARRRSEANRQSADARTSQFEREFNETRSRNRKDFERSQADFKFRRF